MLYLLIATSLSATGFVHLDHSRLELGAQVIDQRLDDDISHAPPAPLAQSGPDIWVYGYLPYWADNLNTVPWDQLSHVAIFDVGLESDGSLSDTSRWTSIASEAVEIGNQYDVDIHLTVTSFSDSVMSSVLPSSTRRARAISELADLVNSVGASGVSVDFEGMEYSLKADLVTFVKELSQVVDEVTVATPAIDWAGAYDYDGLLLWADALFIMGYGYHWSGGDPGPGAPVSSSSRWGNYCLEWSVGDHLEWGARADQIILGLPLYGHDWPTTSNEIPGTATGSASSVTYAQAVGVAMEHGEYWDSPGETPYTFPDSRSQLWYEDLESMRAKVEYAVDAELLGIGFWALNYDGQDPELWEMIHRLTTDDEDTTGTETLLAFASATELAYVDEEVVLDASLSEGSGISFSWIQTGGPETLVSTANQQVATFRPDMAGSYHFDLIVTDDSGATDTDSVWVEIIRTDAMNYAPAGCGCNKGGRTAGLTWALAMAFFTVIRRNRPLNQS